MKKSLIATLFFCSLFGLQIVLQKLFIKSSIHPLHLNFLTSLTAFVLLTIYFSIFNRKIFEFKQDKKALTLFFVATLSWILADISSIFGLQISSSINFSIISRTQIFITYFCAVLFLKESLKKNKILAIFLSFIGSIIVVYNFQSDIKIGIGDLLFLAFALLISVSGLLRQPLTKLMNPFQLTYFMYGVASVILGLITFLVSPIITVKVPLFIIFNAIIGLAGFTLVNYAIHQAGAAFFSVVTALLPVFTAFFSFLILKQLPSLNQIVGTIIIALGIFLFQDNTTYKS